MLIDDLPVCSISEIGQFLDNELLPKWRKGNATLFRIQPEHVDIRIEKTVESVIANNGTYETGERVVINTRPDALPMAAEIGNVLEKLGYKTCIIYGMFADPPSISRLLAVLPNRRSLELIVSQYKALVDYAQHWMVPYATSQSEPSEDEKEAVAVFTGAVNKGLSKLDEKREKGEMKSVDVIGFPVAHEAKRLGLSLSEWEPILYRAMGVTISEIESEINKTGYMKVLTEAYRGKTLKIIRRGNFPVNLTMKLLNRPIFKDVGKVGERTINFKLFGRITNIPPGELCVAPIEDSVDGEFYTKIPQATLRGTLEGVHIVFKNGRVVKATADRGEEVLHYYVGLAKPETLAEKSVYEAQNTIAELGIGVNPVLDFERITGNPLVDEKMRGIHIATGANKFLCGNTPSAIGGMSVEHWDFIIGKIDEMIAV